MEITQAIAAGILINVESPREVEVVARRSREMQLPARVAVRVNPDFELKSSGMKMGGGPKQFGVDAEVVPALLKDIERQGLELRRVPHLQRIAEPERRFHLRSATEDDRPCHHVLPQALRSPVRVLNIGGGFGIPYFPGEKPLDLTRVGENLRGDRRTGEGGAAAGQLTIELGRYLVGEAGIYVCRVVDRKISRGQIFLVTDGGLHHHLAASGNFGQVVRKNYPVCIGNRVSGGPRGVCSVVGPLCTPLDLLADRMEMADAQPGDLVVVFQSGAYGATASPTRFLSHPTLFGSPCLALRKRPATFSLQIIMASQILLSSDCVPAQPKACSSPARG